MTLVDASRFIQNSKFLISLDHLLVSYSSVGLYGLICFDIFTVKTFQLLAP